MVWCLPEDKMFNFNLIFTLLFFVKVAYCDWIADWLSPVQEQLQAARIKLIDDDLVKIMRTPKSIEIIQPKLWTTPAIPHDTISLKSKLVETMTKAEDLLGNLQHFISTLEKKERKLKDAIVSGRSGISAVTVSMTGETPREYLVQDGVWTFCHGMLQFPTPPSSNQNLLYDIIAEPRCIGLETPATQDPCVFNSVIKYEVIPETRKLEYEEDDIFCLKPIFNKSLEHYHSVPKKVVSATCHGGIVRNLNEQLQQCGSRVMTEYFYYPNKSSTASEYALEYCKESDGSCRLIVAWSLSNRTVENFELLKNDPEFKKLFIQTTLKIAN